MPEGGPEERKEEELEAEEDHITEDGVDGDFVKGADDVYEFVPREPGDKLGDTVDFALASEEEPTVSGLILKQTREQIRSLQHERDKLLIKLKEPEEEREGVEEMIIALEARIQLAMEIAKKEIAERAKEKESDK